MAKQIEDEVAYYYDSHPTEEDLIGETSDHAALVSYLMAVLTWLFHGQRCAICYAVSTCSGNRAADRRCADARIAGACAWRVEFTVARVTSLIKPKSSNQLIAPVTIKNTTFDSPKLFTTR